VIITKCRKGLSHAIALIGVIALGKLVLHLHADSELANGITIQVSTFSEVLNLPPTYWYLSRIGFAHTVTWRNEAIILLYLFNYMDNMGIVFLLFVQQNTPEVVKNKYTWAMFLFIPLSS
jgi:hypothetical protein